MEERRTSVFEIGYGQKVFLPGYHLREFFKIFPQTR